MITYYRKMLSITWLLHGDKQAVYTGGIKGHHHKETCKGPI